MRWLLSSSITLSLATGVIAVAEEPIVANDTTISIMSEAGVYTPLFMGDEYIVQMMAEEQAKKEKSIADVYAGDWSDFDKNTVAMEERFKLLEEQIGITPWVFGGSTTSAWDCSGMVKWFYQGLGLELRHGASAQKNSGVKVYKPKRGDIVSFGFDGDTAGHVGLYITPDVMLHAGGQPGQKTSYRSISEFNIQYGELEYTRIIQTN
jgi:hypothetical protein